MKLDSLYRVSFGFEYLGVSDAILQTTIRNESGFKVVKKGPRINLTLLSNNPKISTTDL